MQLDPSQEYDFDVKSTVLESGKVKNRIIVFPKSYKQQDFKLGSGFVLLLPGALNFAALFANNLNRKR